MITYPQPHIFHSSTYLSSPDYNSVQALLSQVVPNQGDHLLALAQFLGLPDCLIAHESSPGALVAGCMPPKRRVLTVVDAPSVCFSVLRATTCPQMSPKCFSCRICGPKRELGFLLQSTCEHYNYAVAGSCNLEDIFIPTTLAFYKQHGTVDTVGRGTVTDWLTHLREQQQILHPTMLPELVVSTMLDSFNRSDFQHLLFRHNTKPALCGSLPRAFYVRSNAPFLTRVSGTVQMLRSRAEVLAYC